MKKDDDLRQLLIEKELRRWSLTDTIKKVEEYRAKNYYSVKENKPRGKDFYNFFDGTVTCGKCNKTLSAFRSIFHWHKI